MRPCGVCGAIFAPRKASAVGKYCSALCRNRGNARNRGRGAAHPAWRGARTVTSNGYIEITTVDGRRLKEHRYVMEQVLGRPLRSNEHVHHVNGDRRDNRPENLELWLKSQPPGQRVEDLVAWATGLLRSYAPERLTA